MKLYKDYMDSIEVPPELKERFLKTLREAEENHEKENVLIRQPEGFLMRFMKAAAPAAAVLAFAFLFMAIIPRGGGTSRQTVLQAATQNQQAVVTAKEGWRPESQQERSRERDDIKTADPGAYAAIISYDKKEIVLSAQDIAFLKSEIKDGFLSREKAMEEVSAPSTVDSSRPERILYEGEWMHIRWDLMDQKRIQSWEKFLAEKELLP